MVSSTKEFTPAEKRRFRFRLLRWYDEHKRPLPWRGASDPYRILVSEIMLQQTRVAVVEQRYHAFLRRFPTVSRLARARTSSVLAEWSGLGYYRRARALHLAAKEITKTRAFPRTSAELQELPGIGRYTANAVASIAFGHVVPVVDGNVKRVLGRLRGQNLLDEECWQMADGLLSKARPGDFNQALMELGAMVCLPTRPLCSECPVRELCRGRGDSVRTASSARKKGFLAFGLRRRNGSILLVRRDNSASLMPGMWELPSRDNGIDSESTPVMELRHSITDTDYSVFVHAVEHGSSARGRWVRLASAGRLPLTGLTRKILQRLRAND